MSRQAQASLNMGNFDQKKIVDAAKRTARKIKAQIKKEEFRKKHVLKK